MVKSRENRVPMMLSNEELEAIDTWRFANRVATRSEAIRRLCQMGLHLDQKMKEIERSRMIAFYALQRMRTVLGIPDEHGPIDQATITSRSIDLHSLQAQGKMVSGSISESGHQEDALPETVEDAFYDVLTCFRDFELEIYELMDAAFHVKKIGMIGQILAELKENPIIHQELRERRKANDTDIGGT